MPPAAPVSPSPFNDPFQDIALQQDNRSAPAATPDFQSERPASPEQSRQGANNDFYDYGSINLEPMERPSIPEGIEVKSMHDQRPGQESSSLEKTDLDLEIERYQREIDEKQHKMRPSSLQQQQSAQQHQQPLSQPPQRSAGYDVYEPIESAEPRQQMPSYQSPYTADDQQAGSDDQPLYFTSVNTDRQKKPKKAPVNPKNRSQGSFFSKLFNKDKP
jgi:hypothetical protein